MPEVKSYYDALPKGTVINLVKAKAEDQLNIDLDQYDRIGFVFAGERNNHVGGTAAVAIGNIFTCYEKYGPINDETFAHIGIATHEFAHTLGAEDEYKGEYPQADPRRWCLMSYGLYCGGTPTANGDDGKGSCPAHFSPAYRIRFNWVAPVILEPQEDFVVQYNYSSPIFYKINIPGSSEYFIIERRRKDGFDFFTPQYEGSSNYPPQGILIWHIASDAVYGDLVQLEPSNNYYPPGVNGVRFPLSTIQDFTDFTLPSSNRRNGDNSFISVKNIEWIGNQQTGYAELDYVFEALEITGTQTWSTTRSLAVPVYIKDEGTLNITNGAYIHFNGDFVEQVKIIVEDGGTLNLTGSENHKVVLLSGDFEQPIRKWGGIEIHGSGTLESNFTIIQDALKPIQVFQDNASCSLDNTEIVGYSVSLSGDVVIENSIFYGASLYINRSNNGSRIKRTIFLSELPNQLYVQLGLPGVSYLEVANCTFNGMNLGLAFGIDDPTWGDRTNQITVRNNIFSNCYKSIYIYGGSVSISYNDFYNNNYNEFTGSNYLAVNPLYVDPENNDFNLQWGSACIDAGHPSAVYNDPDGTRNDMGAKYYDQSPVIPTNFTIIPDPEYHPLLEWEGAPHLDYKVYALYEYPDSTSANQVYQTLTESYVDETVTFYFTIGEPNQLVTYSVTSINSIDEESVHSEEITIDAYGRIPKNSGKDSIFIPYAYSLFNPYPNPFNPSTTVIFDIPEKSFVSIKLYSITGEVVRTIVNEQMDAGRRHFLIEGNGLSSGVYLLRMISNDFICTKKIIMMK